MGTPLQVLLVEDSQDDAELVLRELRRGGYELVSRQVESPEAMRTALEQQPWDIIISDYSMPRFTGMEALKLLQEKGIDIPFILVSGTVGEDVAVLAMKEGAHDYLMKGNLARLAPAVERELREAKIRRKRRRDEARFRGLLESAPDAMVVSGEGGRIVLVNHQTERLFGYAREELLGRMVETLIPDHPCVGNPHDRQGSPTGARRSPAGGGAERRGLRKDGSEFPAEISLSPLEAGSDMLVVSAIRDVTERKRAERELREALRKATESDRLKNVFLANISHEIRTPLNVILGFSTLIGERLAELGEEGHGELLQRIERSSQRLLDTVNHILDYSRIMTGDYPLRPSAVQPHRILEPILRECERLAAEKGLSFSWSNELHDEAVWFDENCLAGAARCLLDNAVKFTSRGEVSVRLWREGDDLRLAIHDTGVGIDPEYISRLFEPFTQQDSGLTRSYEGTGLGLSLAKRYLELNGATLRVDSRRAVGSTFTIDFPSAGARAEDARPNEDPPKGDAEVNAAANDLPARDPSATDAPARGAPPPDASARGTAVRHATPKPNRSHPRVLIVEDDPATQVYMKELLGKRYEVLVASSARKARRHLAAYGKEIGAIVLDIALGRSEDGLALTRDLRSQACFRDIRVIAVTAHALPEDERNAFAAGCDRFLPKPVDPAALLAVVDEMLTRP